MNLDAFDDEVNGVWKAVPIEICNSARGVVIKGWYTLTWRFSLMVITLFNTNT